MGDFIGHAGPGSGFLFIGLFLFLQALNISITQPFRYTKKWISFEGWCKIVFAIVGAFLELTLMNSWKLPFYQSHYDHFQMYSIVFISGFGDLLHIHRVLKENGWCLISPLSFVFFAVLMSAHMQETYLQTFGHKVTTVLLLVLAFSRIAQLLISLHTNEKHHKHYIAQQKKSLRIEQIPTKYSWDWNQFIMVPCRCFPYSGKGYTNQMSPQRGIARNGYHKQHRLSISSPERSEHLLSINSAYTNPLVYQTVFPLSTACLAISIGIWWWQMAWNFYLFPLPTEQQEGHHGMSEGYWMLYLNFIVTIFGCSLLSIILHKIDHWISLRRKNYVPMESLDSSSDGNNLFSDVSSVECDREKCDSDHYVEMDSRN